ncbi:MAG TPA: hypothetical protein VH302_10780 [Bryobacteraceae bacterium]|jgi:hypothetical protein|nr:hypothetical protein [Bryobacteraceae bacterium]
MPIQVLCKICGKRRARRACPAVQGDICTICCGTEREVSLSCPLVCEYLQEAHMHEKPVPIADDQISYTEVPVTEEFIREHEELLLFSVYSLVQAAIRTPGALDADVMAALEALIQTHRTLQSGLVYETRAENMIAASVQRGFSGSLADYQKLRQEREGLPAFRESDLLFVLVFLHRLGQQNQNGRPRGRMFLDLLRHMTPDVGVEERAPSIIL